MTARAAFDAAAAVSLDAYDRTPQFRESEAAALACFLQCTHDPGGRPKEVVAALSRFMHPLEDVRRRMGYRPMAGVVLQRTVLRDMHARSSTFWMWGADEWLATVQRAQQANASYAALGGAYLLAGHRALHREVPWFQRRRFAAQMLGDAAVATAIDGVIAALNHAGCNGSGRSLWHVVLALCGLFLDAGSTQLAALWGGSDHGGVPA